MTKRQYSWVNYLWMQWGPHFMFLWETRCSEQKPVMKGLVTIKCGTSHDRKPYLCSLIWQYWLNIYHNSSFSIKDAMSTVSWYLQACWLNRGKYFFHYSLHEVYPLPYIHPIVKRICSIISFLKYKKFGLSLSNLYGTVWKNVVSWDEIILQAEVHNSYSN